MTDFIIKKRPYDLSSHAGVGGYCPFAVYLGSLGYCLELALRPGVQHSAAESQYNFEHALPMAASLVSSPLLVRSASTVRQHGIFGYSSDFLVL